jgi:hypothetical protein
MKKIRPTNNKVHWPRNRVKTIDCRGRDLIVRIADWMTDKDEPAFDVEVYIGGVYDFNESETFTMFKYKDQNICKQKAIEFAQQKIAAIL